MDASPFKFNLKFLLEFIGGADDLGDVSVPPISCSAWEGSLISELHPGARFGKLILDNLSGAPSPSLSLPLPFSLTLINMLQLHTLEQPYASFCKHSHARRRSAINQETSEYDENGSDTGHLRTCPPPLSSGKCILNEEEREREKGGGRQEVTWPHSVAPLHHNVNHLAPPLPRDCIHTLPYTPISELCF